MRRAGSITNIDREGGQGETSDLPVTNEDITRRTGESTAAEDEKRRNLADLWMERTWIRPGTEVYQARANGQPLDQLRRKYGDEAVDERSQAVDDLLPAFDRYVKSGLRSGASGDRGSAQADDAGPERAADPADQGPRFGGLPEGVHRRYESGGEAGGRNDLFREKARIEATEPILLDTKNCHQTIVSLGALRTCLHGCPPLRKTSVGRPGRMFGQRSIRGV